MPRRPSVFVLPLLLVVPALAQDVAPLAPPAPEVQKFAPLIGHWVGKGAMHEPSGDNTPWQAHGTYRWCLGGHFVQEDMAITFEGNDVPLVIRSYLGWDRERGRCVSVVASNGGQTQMHELKWLPDGTMLQLAVQDQPGMVYAERVRLQVAGDTMSYAVDMLMEEGPSMMIVDGVFTRGEKAFDGAFDTVGWMGAQPHADMQRLARLAGAYAIEGQMVMVPGQPATKITGTDTFRPVFGGTVVHGHTDGAAEGAPAAYSSHAFWAHDAKRGCVLCVYVDNMGAIGSMELRYVGDALVSTSVGTMNGQPMTQRFVIEFDANGTCKSGLGHTMVGTAPPFESFRSTYKKK